MTAVAYRPREIEAFSLYWHWTKKLWQMNVRRKGEAGWDITHIPDEQAQAIFSMLETSGHPDGPWSVKQVETWKSLDGPALAKEIHASKIEPIGDPVVPKPEGVSNPGTDPWLEGIANRDRSGLAPSYNAPEDIADFAALLDDWRSAFLENAFARRGI